MVAALCLADNQRLDRRWLRRALWSDLEEDRAGNNLRQVLHTLTNTLIRPNDLTALSLQADALTIGTGDLACDLWLVNASVEATLDEALIDRNYYFEGLASDLDDLDPAFARWLTERRDTFRKRALRTLESRLRANSSSDDVRDLARAILNLNPLHERACRGFMQSAAMAGDTVEALTAYQALWHNVDEAFGEEPSAVTKELAVAIKNGEVPSPPALTVIPVEAEPTAPAPARPRILVAEIQSDHAEPDELRVLKGFRTELMTHLVRFREWRVRDMTYAAPTEADYVLRLDGFSSDAALMVSLTLIDITTGDYVWSESFDFAPGAWAERQSDIVRRLAVAVNVQISVDRISRVAAGGGFTLSVFDRWLKGQELMMKMTPESWHAAETLLDDLIQTAPGFSRGLSSRAAVENMRHLTFPGQLPTRRSQSLALELARRAVSIDPLDSRAQLHLGWAAAMSGSFGQSEIAFSLAHGNNENDPWTLVSAAIGLAFCDRTDAADRMIAAGRKLDLEPTPAYWSYVAAVRFLAGDYEGCVATSEKAEEITADVPAWHAAALSHLGRDYAAEATLDRFIARAGDLWHADEPPSEAAFATWVLSSFPIRNPARWRALRDGLSAAGLSVPHGLARAETAPRLLSSAQALRSI